jgi:hypothetical protein
MKKLLACIVLMLLSFVLNFSIYNYSFNKQATPFISEEQRMDSVLLMMKTTIPAYAMSSIIVVLLGYWLAAKFRTFKGD